MPYGIRIRRCNLLDNNYVFTAGKVGANAKGAYH